MEFKTRALSLVVIMSCSSVLWAQEQGAAVCGDGTVTSFIKDLDAQLSVFDKSVGVISLRLVKGLAESSVDDVTNIATAQLPELLREIKENKNHLKDPYVEDLELLESAVSSLRKEMLSLKVQLDDTRQCAQGLSMKNRSHAKISCVTSGDGVACKDLVRTEDDYTGKSRACHLETAEPSFARYAEMASITYNILESHRRKKAEFDAALNPPANADCRRKSCVGAGLAQKCKTSEDSGCVGSRNWAKEGLSGLGQQDDKMVGAVTFVSVPLWNRLDKFRQDEAMALSASYDAQLKKLKSIIRKKRVIYVAYPDIYEYLEEHLRSGLASLDKAAVDCFNNSGAQNCDRKTGWRSLKDDDDRHKPVAAVRGSHHTHAALGQLSRAVEALKEIERHEKACAAKKLRLSARMVWDP